MPTRPSTNGERTSRRVAAAYRKKGYEVVLPAGQGNLPEFLRGCGPDLIAQRDDDRVVVEIKPAGSLKGANDLVDLAERVAGQPGWRLELVTFRDRDPDGDTVASEWLEQMLQGPGDNTLISVYRLEILGFLLRGIAARAGIRAAGKVERTLAQELAFGGHIDAAILARIEAALRWRDDVMHSRSADLPPSAEQAAELERLCREVLAQANQVAAT
jgi:hypothetical protein